MSAQRYVVLGLARVGAPWFSDVARWSTSAALPVEFVKAISADEARVRLESGRAFSALLVDESVVGFDRELLATADDHGCAVLVVSAGGPGVSLVPPAHLLPRDLTRDDLLRSLAQVCSPIDRRVEPTRAGEPGPAGARGQLVAVTGSGGTGASTIAMGLAQLLAADPRRSEQVCLADCCLVADQGTLHGAPDVVPSVLELSEAHRLGRPGADDVRSHTWRVADRAYHLLLGLRQRRDWTSLRSRSFDAALASLRSSYALVVADVDDDVDGERSTGSVDLEERNAMARTVLAEADVVVVVGLPDTIGVHHLLRVTRDVLALGVAPRRILPVFNRSSAGRRARSQLAHSFGQLLDLSDAPAVAAPMHVATKRGVDLAIRDGRPLPDGWLENLSATVDGLLGLGQSTSPGRGRQLVAVTPGELGGWADDGTFPSDGSAR